MKKDSKFRTLLFIIIAGMGNVKQGNWRCILTYFSFIIFLGIGLLYIEQKIIEQYFHPSQTMKIFLILIYIAFVFFWDGTIFIGSKGKNHFLVHDEGIQVKKIRE